MHEQQVKSLQPQREAELEKARKLTRELEPSKESWQVNFGLLTISGESGTGKTALADIMSIIYNIPEENCIKIGREFRSLAPQGENFIKRDATIVDKPKDDKQREIMRKTNPEDPYLLESRLAGMLTYEERAASPDLQIISILLTASPEKSVARVHDRMPELSEEKIREIARERARKDLELWKTVHPNLEDPYDLKYFDLVIDTGTMTLKQVFIYLHAWLLENALISKKEKQPEDDMPIGHQIFPNPND